MQYKNIIKKENIDIIFTSLADQYKKAGGTEKINIFIVGGAAIVINFNYRYSTIDIDALYKENKLIKESIKAVAKSLELPIDWLNHDFEKTPSYSPVLLQKSILYKEYLNLIIVYTLEPKYLIAMKLKSSRPTGGDLDDIIKMIYESRYRNDPLTYEDVIKAYKELYSDFSNTYDYFLVKAKEAFETPKEDFEYLFKRDF